MVLAVGQWRYWVEDLGSAVDYRWRVIEMHRDSDRWDYIHSDVSKTEATAWMQTYVLERALS